MKNAVIVDVDGTLTDITGVLHYVDGSLGYTKSGKPIKDFDKFHEGAAFCPPNQQALDFVDRHHAAGNTIIVVTARMERHRHTTTQWLKNTLTVPFEGPLMREEGDYRKDVAVKNDIYRAIVAAGFTVIEALDDSPNVLQLWTNLGIPTEQVPRPADDSSLHIQHVNQEGV